ncbi:unnamed protein product, partial [Brachionus calyciflorus]
MSSPSKLYNETSTTTNSRQEVVQTASFRFEVRVITHQRVKTTKSSTVSSYSSISNLRSDLIDKAPLQLNTITNSSSSSSSSCKKSLLYSSHESLNKKPNNLTPIILPIRIDEQTSSRTFNLTDNLQSNIKFDVTLKPSLCIRNERLDATSSPSSSLSTNNKNNQSEFEQIDCKNFEKKIQDVEYGHSDNNNYGKLLYQNETFKRKFEQIKSKYKDLADICKFFSHSVNSADEMGGVVDRISSALCAIETQLEAQSFDKLENIEQMKLEMDIIGNLKPLFKANENELSNLKLFNNKLHTKAKEFTSIHLTDKNQSIVSDLKKLDDLVRHLDERWCRASFDYTTRRNKLKECLNTYQNYILAQKSIRISDDSSNNSNSNLNSNNNSNNESTLSQIQSKESTSLKSNINKHHVNNDSIKNTNENRKLTLDNTKSPLSANNHHHHHHHQNHKLRNYSFKMSTETLGTFNYYKSSLISDYRLTLTDLYELNLIDQTNGLIINPLNGNRLALAEAIRTELVHTEINEIYNTFIESRDNYKKSKITINEAIRICILDPLENSIYLSSINPDLKINLYEAAKRNLILKPLTLSDAFIRNLIQKNGLVRNPLDNNLYEFKSLIYNLELSFFDFDTKHIVDPCDTQKKLLSLREAIQLGFILPDSFQINLNYKNLSTFKPSKFINIYDAFFIKDLNPSSPSVFGLLLYKPIVTNTYIKTNCKRDRIGLMEAINLKIIDLNNKTYNLWDSKIIKNKISLEEAVYKYKYVDYDLLDLLMTPIGLKKSGRNLTILDCINDMTIVLDRQLYKNPINNELMLFDSHLCRSIVGEEILLKIKKLVSKIIVKSFLLSNFNTNKKSSDTKIKRDKIMRKSIQTQVTTNSNDKSKSFILDYVILKRLIRTESLDWKEFSKKITIEDAQAMGLLDLERGVYYDEYNNLILSIDQAIDLGLIGVKQNDKITDEDDNSNELINSNNKKVCSHRSTTLAIHSIKNVLTGEYCSINEAIKSGLLDENKLFYINNMNGEKMDLTRAYLNDYVKGEFFPNSSSQNLLIKNKSATKSIVKRDLNGNVTLVELEEKYLNIKAIYDPKTKRFLNIQQAVNNQIFDETTGLYKDPLNNKQYSLNEACLLGLVITDTTKSLEKSPSSILVIDIDDKNKNDVKINSFYSNKEIRVKDKTILFEVTESEEIKFKNLVERIEQVVDDNDSNSSSSEVCLRKSKNSKTILERRISNFIQDKIENETLVINDVRHSAMLDIDGVTHVHKKEVSIDEEQDEEINLSKINLEHQNKTLIKIDDNFQERLDLSQNSDESNFNFDKRSTKIKMSESKGYYRLDKLEHRIEFSQKFEIISVLDPFTGLKYNTDKILELEIINEKTSEFKLPSQDKCLSIDEAIDLGYCKVNLLGQVYEETSEAYGFISNIKTSQNLKDNTITNVEAKDSNENNGVENKSRNEHLFEALFAQINDINKNIYNVQNDLSKQNRINDSIDDLTKRLSELNLCRDNLNKIKDMFNQNFTLTKELFKIEPKSIHFDELRTKHKNIDSNIKKINNELESRVKNLKDILETFEMLKNKFNNFIEITDRDNKCLENVQFNTYPIIDMLTLNKNQENLLQIEKDLKSRLPDLKHLQDYTKKSNDLLIKNDHLLNEFRLNQENKTPDLINNNNSKNKNSLLNKLAESYLIQVKHKYDNLLNKIELLHNLNVKYHEAFDLITSIDSECNSIESQLNIECRKLPTLSNNQKEIELVCQKFKKLSHDLELLKPNLKQLKTTEDTIKNLNTNLNSFKSNELNDRLESLETRITNNQQFLQDQLKSKQNDQELFENLQENLNLKNYNPIETSKIIDNLKNNELVHNKDHLENLIVLNECLNTFNLNLNKIE